ncbi:hypothetical protein [Rhodococcus sp. WAY2]|uniref:hypothetical protein n=1 Tax=Rhodococcus sp. WAY2 TaxID=2663121 RepID=UPI00131FD019|nr:hypothetical protein [Rhodococcus sp. WAY2]QHE73553.1 hypothetical protein GFS60_07213 [Rhodococcus sp. WAY2]
MLFPYSNSDVAVSHYSDWSFSHWLFAGAVLLASVLLTVIAVGLWTAAIPEDNIVLYAGSAGVGTLAVVLQATSLWQIARHIELYRVVVFLALAVVVAVVVSVRSTVRNEPSGTRGYYGLRVPKWVIRVPVLASAVIAVGVVIGDGVTRAAASIPMAVGLFVLLFLSAVGYVVVNAMSPSASRR